MKKLRIEYIEEENHQFWDEFVMTVSYSTIFNTSCFGKVFSEATKYSFQIISVKKEERIIAGIMFFYKKVLSKGIVCAPQLSPYSGLLYNFRKTKHIYNNELFHYRICKLIIDELSTKNILINLKLNPGFNDIRPFIWRNFHSITRYTYQINYKDLSEIYGRLHTNAKARIKKAKRYQYEFLVSKTGIDEKKLYSLLNESITKNKGKISIDMNRFKRIIQTFFDAGKLIVFSSEINSICVSAYAVLVYQNKAFIWLGGNKKSHLYTGVSTATLYDALCYLVSHGYNEIDFVGANNEKTAVFKSQFNFKLTNYYQLIYKKNFCLKVLNKLFME